MTMPLRPRPKRFAAAWRAAAVAVLLAVAPGTAQACGPDTDCVVGDRTYRIRLPDLPADGARIGAIVLAHGYRDTAANIMAYTDLGAAVAALGLALVAPQSKGEDWTLPNAPSGGRRPRLDEVADMRRLLADVAARFPVERSRIMAAGMSAGGMLVWHLACHGGDLFAGYAPISGTFWAPVPTTCPTGPVTILHSHGTDDAVVPLAGRAIRDTRQGDVAEAIRRYGAFGGFGPPAQTRAADLDCTRRSNPAGRVLELCLHPGGHDLRTEDVVRAWRTLAALNGW
jgi:polyhydroxybutyrate depolymerase